MIARRILGGVLLTGFLFLAGCTASPTSTSSANPQADDGMSLVGIGDSIPGAGGDCDQRCDSYVVLLADAATVALGQDVSVTNLGANTSVTAQALAATVHTDEDVRATIAAAEIIVITVGFNDWEGPCSWQGKEGCTTRGTATVSRNLGAILDDIVELRAGQPTAIRVTNYYNYSIGNPGALAAWGVPAGEEQAFAEFYASALAELDTAICEAAEEHDALCVDLVVPFNGADGSTDAGDLLGGDHLHPSQKGHQLIADAVAAAGFAPVG